MSKKIMILNGSPRRKGNTSTLIQEFIKGAEEVGHIISHFFLSDMDINGCKGCYGGGKDLKSPCLTKDDMDKIYPVYKESDIVVLASPVYYWTISGQLKMALDRLFAVAECNPDYQAPKKNSILIMAAEGDCFAETVYWYDRLMKHISWQDLGKILASGVVHIGDINGHPELIKAYELAKAI